MVEMGTGIGLLLEGEVLEEGGTVSEEFPAGVAPVVILRLGEDGGRFGAELEDLVVLGERGDPVEVALVDRALEVPAPAA